MTTEGNDLYISQQEASTSRISKLDVTDVLPTSTVDVLASILNPHGIIFNGADLYVSLDSDGKVIKYTEGTLSTINVDVEESISLYPNPFKDVIKVKNFKHNETYFVYDSSGLVVSSGTLIDDGEIDTSNFASGLYYLTINNSTTKFIKY